MIVLDTNVLSELMLAVPDPRVLAWVDQEPEQTLYTTAVTEAEIRIGIALMPCIDRGHTGHLFGDMVDTYCR